MKRQKLSQKAMLVSFEVSIWSARCKDDRVTAEVAEKYNSDKAMGTFTKKLAPKEALAELRKLRAHMKRFHKEQTLPWDDRFNRVLLASNFDSYSRHMRVFRAHYESLVSDFIAGYPSVIEEARAKLNGLFNEQDYPDPSEIEGSFGVKLEIAPFPEASDFRVHLQEEEIEAIREDIASRMDSAVKYAMQDVWSRLFQQVQRMAERLKDLDEPIRWDYVADLRSLLDILPRLNLTGDKELERLAAEAKMRLAGRDIEELKNIPEARVETAQAAADIMAAMAGYMGE
jgi:hypothetical protein